MEIAVWHGGTTTRVTFSGEETVTEVYLNDAEAETLWQLLEPPKAGLP